MEGRDGRPLSSMKHAYCVWKKRFFPLAGRTLLFALLRVPPLLCLFCAVRDEPPLLPAWAWALLSVLTHALLVIPARGYYRRALSGELGFSQSRGGFGRFLRLGLVRYLRGLLWGLPFLAGVGLFLYCMEAVSFQEQGLMFEAIARFFGYQQGDGLVVKGAALYFVLLIPLLLLFLWGWRRDVPADTLIVCSDDEKVFSASRALRKAGSSCLRHCTRGNFCLYLPGLALSLAALIPYVRENLRVSGNIAVMWHSVRKMTDRVPPVTTLLLLAAALLLAALPLCVLRRLRVTAAVCDLTEEKTGGSHAAG